MKYPLTKQTAASDTYFGTTVADPYRWMEDDRSAETKEWVDAQNVVTQDYLSRIPYRNAIKERLTSLLDYEKFSSPFKEGDYTYYYKNSGLQNQSVLYREKDGMAAEVFLDPNTFSEDGTTSLADVSFSKDGSLVAYQLSHGGSDWRTVTVLRTDDKSVVGDSLVDVKFSGIAWKGNEGFYYSSYDKPADGSELSGITQQHKLYYHALGSAQAEDALVFGGAETPRRYIGGYLTEDERFLVITAANSTSGNELYLQDLRIDGSAIVPLVGHFEKNHYVIANDDSKLYIYTNAEAPNGRIVTTDAADPVLANWKTFIAETENVLEPSTAGGKIFASYIKDAVSLVLQYSFDGTLEHEVALPGVGSAGGFSSKCYEKELYYTFTSYVYPATIFRYDVETGVSVVYKR